MISAILNLHIASNQVSVQSAILFWGYPLEYFTMGIDNFSCQMSFEKFQDGPYVSHKLRSNIYMAT